MGMLGKLKFWKKEEPGLDDFGAEPGQDMGMTEDRLGLGASAAPGTEGGELGLPAQQQTGIPTPHEEPVDYSTAFGMPKRRLTGAAEPETQPSPTAFPQQERRVDEKNFEILSNKLDAIKSSLESINHRLTLLEALARSSEKGEEERRGPRRRVW